MIERNSFVLKKDIRSASRTSILIYEEDEVESARNVGAEFL